MSLGPADRNCSDPASINGQGSRFTCSNKLFAVSCMHYADLRSGPLSGGTYVEFKTKDRLAPDPASSPDRVAKGSRTADATPAGDAGEVGHHGTAMADLAYS